MSVALLEGEPPNSLGELEVRRRIDQAVSRALVDARYAARLLDDPTIALGDTGCTPQQRVSLRGIRAATLREFAQQACDLFWPVHFESDNQSEVPVALAR